MIASLLVSCAGSAATPPTAPTVVEGPAVAIVGARVFDGVRVLDRATVVVAGGTIAAVGPDVAVPPGAERVDGAGRTLLPGLIDAHTHCRGREALAQAATFGVTTELDMMCPPAAAAALRTAARTEPIADFRSAGNPVTVPGGHGTEYGIPIPTLARADDTERFVADRVAEGSDWLKIIVDDATPWDRPIPTLSEDEVRRAVAAAHAHHLLAVAHVGTADDARIAVDAGVDGLAHLYDSARPEPELVARIAAKHAFVVPTLSVLYAVCAPGRIGPGLAADPQLAPYLSTTSLASLRATFLAPGADCSGLGASVVALHAAGVPLLAGTDAPNPGTAHGASLHSELGLLVDAGLSPADALVAATSAPAAAFGLTDRGRIEVGKRADLVLVQGDPTRDVTATRDIVAVWVRGQAVTRDRRVPAPAVGGLVSDFRDGTPSSRFGSGWTATTDRLAGGSSVATLTVRDGALHVEGEVRQGPGLWSGAWFTPGARPREPVDLSGVATIRLRARGDPGEYAVMVFTASGGALGRLQPIQVGRDWAQVEVPFALFGVAGTDVTGIFVGSKRIGAYALDLDDVALEP